MNLLVFVTNSFKLGLHVLGLDSKFPPFWAVLAPPRLYQLAALDTTSTRHLPLSQSRKTARRVHSHIWNDPHGPRKTQGEFLKM